MQPRPPEKLTTLGLKRNKIGWVVVEITTEDGQVVEQIESTPEIRAVATETLRRKFAALIARTVR